MQVLPGCVRHRPRFPGGKKAGQMGNEQVTVQNLQVVKIDPENHLILVKGQVPGPKNGLVFYLKPLKEKEK